MNLSDPRSVRKSKQAVRLNRQRELDDLKAVCSTFQGRRFVKRILDKSGMFGLYFEGDNSGMNAFYEGRRSIGVVVFNDLNEVDPSLYQTMLQDAKKDPKPTEDDDHDALYHPKATVTIPKQEDTDDERHDD